MRRSLFILAALWFAVGQLFAQEKPQKINIPESCLVVGHKGDTLRIRTLIINVDDPIYWQFSERMKFEYDVIIYSDVADRIIVLSSPRSSSLPHWRILGIEVKQTYTEIFSIHHYVKVKEKCKKLRQQIAAELKKRDPNLTFYW